jgi:hypothetical protein
VVVCAESNAKAVCESKGFQDLSLDRVLVLVQDNDLCIKEVDLWSAVLRWGKAQIRLGRTKDKDLKTVLAAVVPHIRFPLFSVQEFASSVQGMRCACAVLCCGVVLSLTQALVWWWCAGSGVEIFSTEQALQLYSYIAQRMPCHIAPLLLLLLQCKVMVCDVV